jgi:dTDP-4-amino-4,6-dideoxygalactose transaminase
MERDDLQKKMKEHGIQTMIYYPRGLHQQKAFEKMSLDDQFFPNTIEATNRVLSLPMHPYLTEEDVDIISRTMLNII